jgi:hypothetical protein
MAIDINSTVLQNSSNVLEAVVGATKLFEYRNNGVLNRSSVNASWLTGNSTVNWIALTANAWTEYLGWTTLYRVTPTTASFTNSGRFYAPVRGLYMFSLSCYAYSGTTGWYIHPGVWINGSSNRGTPSNNHSHRIRGHGITGGYAYDLNFSEMKFMEAGDYASCYFYAGGGGNIFGSYNTFSGYLLG